MNEYLKKYLLDIDFINILLYVQKLSKYDIVTSTYLIGTINNKIC